MALQMPYTDSDTGAVHAVAYFRVIGVSMRPAGPSADIHVQAYTSSAASGAEKTPIRQDVVRVPPADFSTVFPGTAPISSIVNRAYNYLKTLPFFEGAIDV